MGQKVGPEVGFSLLLYGKTYFQTYFLTYFDSSPENLLLSYLNFSGISGIVVAHAGRHNKEGKENHQTIKVLLSP